MQYEDQKKKEAMAMKYWEQKKIEEQVSYLIVSELVVDDDDLWCLYVCSGEVF